MNYRESKQALEEIGRAKKILLALHEAVDPDSIVSNLAMRKYLLSIGKEVELVYCEKLPPMFTKLYKIEGVTQGVDFAKFNFQQFDLFVTLDVGETRRLRIPPDVSIPIKTINIDHHATRNDFTGIKIIDSTFSSTAEMIFYLLDDFRYSIDVETANWILLGIITDTETFNYNVSPRVFKTISRLLEIGADFDRANVITYRNNTLDQLKFWAVALNKMKVDKKHKFAYSAVSFEEQAPFKGVLHASRSVADKFARTLEGTNFGIVMTQKESGELKISIRSRELGYNLVPLLVALGGGGHLDGGGAVIKGLTFEKAVAKTLAAARKFVNDRKNKED